MKGWISGIKRMEIHDGEGLRTTVFFKGCPLRCLWCHNPESLSFERQIAYFKGKCISCGACRGERTAEAAERCPTGALAVYGREYEAEALAEALSVDAPFFGEKGGVTLSGGECLAQPEFAVALAKALFERGIGVYIDTCGYARREVLEKLIPYTEKFLYDLKAISEQVHLGCTGKGNARILDNLAFLCERGCRVEIRYPLVKGYNDGECERIAAFLCGLAGIEKIKVLQYHSFSASRYEALEMPCRLPTEQTAVEDVERAVRVFESFGLFAVNGAKED